MGLAASMKAIVLVLLLAACGPIEATSPYDELLARFHHMIGYGVDAYTPQTALHFPMAYAQAASATAARYAGTGHVASRGRAIAAAAWLVEHARLNGEIVAWGLPFAWDAFQDGSVNPEHTPYAITTALAMQALLDVHGITGDQELLGTALAAGRDLVEHMVTIDETGAWAWYSRRDPIPVFNITAMVAGQLRRLPAPDLWQVADAMVTHVLSHRGSDGRWAYGTTVDRPNDLVHAAYIAQGLADYARFGGDVPLDVRSLYDSLAAFLDGEMVTEFPNEPGRAARDWGVGAALYASLVLEQDLGIRPGLSRAFRVPAVRYAREVSVFYPRQAAHVLLGLSAP